MRPYERAAWLGADGMVDQAYDVLVHAMRTDSDDPTVLALTRNALESRRNFPAALIAARRVVAVAPDDGVQWDRLAAVLLSMDRFDEARVAIDRAIELAPENPVHWHQAGLLAYRTGDLDRSLEMYDEARKLNPYGAALNHDRAHAILALGRDLPTALGEYEARWESLYHLSPWDLRLPEWKGEPIGGKRFLLHSEQGLGDAIMTARFARDLVDLGAAEVGLVLPDELIRLVSVQDWPRVRAIGYEGLSRDDWDVHSPAFSALRWLGYQVDDIDGRPYLAAPPFSVPPLPRAGKLVGICWASGIRNVDTGSRRHAPLEEVMRLAEVPGVKLLSLQKGRPAEEVRAGGFEAFVAEPLEDCADFAETAAVVDRLDAVVTVDTAMVHLAGALGKPTFMLNQYTRCWRWWRIPTCRPWYDTVVSAKQTDPHDWATPIEAAATWLDGL